jgi:hypothetical protein
MGERQPLPRHLRDAFDNVPGLLIDWRSGPEPSVSVEAGEISVSGVCRFVLLHEDRRLPELVRADILGLLDERYESLIEQLAEGAGYHAGARVPRQYISDRHHNSQS